MEPVSVDIRRRYVDDWRWLDKTHKKRLYRLYFASFQVQPAQLDAVRKNA